MQAALLGTYSNGVVELDEPIAKENGNRVVVVFLDKSGKKEESDQKNSVNKMCGIFIFHFVSFSVLFQGLLLLLQNLVLVLSLGCSPQWLCHNRFCCNMHCHG